MSEQRTNDQTVDEGFEHLLRGFLSQLPESEPLTAGLDLRAAGLDSLGTVEMLMDIEQTYGVEFPDEALTFEVFATPAALWTAISALRDGAVLRG
ncbi:acyl carrier protein [Saccharothrix ecbatanensis]|uniref:Acyl carrier protein n=1 Tax=Saccharothrix ecbatanensis TaxID=1105145 RepID=A0A7W9LY28_9PSEU|nr:phosphopantetheine-binding protein [Saccharothrix ecbatanensis]MBB5800278.1 acyl carrier protein [Saccharothrix ecbatanensis]